MTGPYDLNSKPAGRDDRIDAALGAINDRLNALESQVERFDENARERSVRNWEGLESMVERLHTLERVKPATVNAIAATGDVVVALDRRLNALKDGETHLHNRIDAITGEGSKVDTQETRIRKLKEQVNNMGCQLEGLRGYTENIETLSRRWADKLRGNLKRTIIAVQRLSKGHTCLDLPDPEDL
jgi:chromosome segregation ATPase